MSNKRPLSPELTNGLINDKNNPTNIRSLKRFKLHSIIEELRNEEANLVLLKKLRASQQLINRTHNTSNHSNNNHNHISTKTTATNGFHSTTATRVLSTNKSHTSIQPPSSIKSIPQVISTTARKPTNSINPTVTSTKIPNTLPQKSASSLTLASIDERKTQAKKALRSQLERDLLNIPAPKPLLQDISFIPNPTSLEFQPFIGLEDVVQCLYELQMDRQRLPQRLTDRAQVDEPFVCEQCGTDFTIRWWKHLNSNQQTNILCDRCKKQVTRRTLKSEHSTLLKNVFISAMEQEKEIEKTFQTLIKQQQQQIQQQQQQQQQQQKVASRSPQMTTKSNLNNLSIPSIPSYNPNSQSQKAKIKPSSIPQVQNFATKLSQQPMNATRKSNTIIPPPSSSSAPANRSIPHQKTSLPVHQQQYRSSTALPQSSKSNQAIKMHKPVVRQQAQASSLLSSRPLFPPATSLIPPLTLHPAIPPSTTSRPTATKRRTLPPVNIK